jgi:hypothetical protein
MTRHHRLCVASIVPTGLQCIFRRDPPMKSVGCFQSVPNGTRRVLTAWRFPLNDVLSGLISSKLVSVPRAQIPRSPSDRLS